MLVPIIRAEHHGNIEAHYRKALEDENDMNGEGVYLFVKPKEGEEKMKAVKKVIFFITTYNVIFIFILNLQYIFRFNKQDDFITMFMYSSIISIGYSIVPLICFILSWFILKSITIPLKKIGLKLAILLLITVISTYTLIELIVDDSIFTLITISTTTLTLFLFFITYRKSCSLTH